MIIDDTRTSSKEGVKLVWDDTVVVWCWRTCHPDFDDDLSISDATRQFSLSTKRYCPPNIQRALTNSMYALLRGCIGFRAFAMFIARYCTDDEDFMHTDNKICTVHSKDIVQIG